MINLIRCSRLLFIICIISIGAITTIGTGGGDGGADQLGEVQSLSLESNEVGVSYSISVATPPGYDESGDPYPAVFVLDGNYYFQSFRKGFYDDDGDVIIVAINNSHRRDTD